MGRRYKGDRKFFIKVIFPLLGIFIFCGGVFAIVFIAVYGSELHFHDYEADDFHNTYSYDKNGPTNVIEEKVSLMNKEEIVRNEDIFGKFDNYSVVIAIQVHKDKEYLQYLVKSLENAYGINSAFLIFSHDFFDEEINNLVKSIRFCKVMQIFYPHSLQIHPNVFPGLESNDCTPNMKKEEAIHKKCLNAFYFDSFDKYRNPKLSEAKLHWWWKANRIFDLATLKTYNGSVLFLEEDNYVLEDFIHVLKLMENVTQSSCNYCKVLSLSANFRVGDTLRPDTNIYRVAITNKLSNLGMAFNRSLWTEIANCKYSFCFHDDYHFDMSLRNVFRKCIGNVQHLVLYAPRVFRLPACGLHYRSEKCNTTKNQDLQGKINKWHHENANYLYPARLQLITQYYNPSLKLHGRWGDPRDRALCLGMTIK